MEKWIEYFCDSCKTFFNVKMKCASHTIHCPLCSADDEFCKEIKMTEEPYDPYGYIEQQYGETKEYREEEP